MKSIRSLITIKTYSNLIKMKRSKKDFPFQEDFLIGLSICLRTRKNLLPRNYSFCHFCMSVKFTSKKETKGHSTSKQLYSKRYQMALSLQVWFHWTSPTISLKYTIWKECGKTEWVLQTKWSNMEHQGQSQTMAEYSFWSFLGPLIKNWTCSIWLQKRALNSLKPFMLFK